MTMGWRVAIPSVVLFLGCGNCTIGNEEIKNPMVRILGRCGNFTIENKKIGNPMVRFFGYAVIVPLKMRKSGIQW